MQYNSDNFDLSNWKITLPLANDKGKALEVKELQNYEHEEYFYDAADGAMVFRASAESAATTKGSKYARSELREMDGDERAFWSLEEGGTMTATLQIDETPIYKDGDPGRIIVGQIHGIDDELVRLYYEGGKLYFENEHAGDKDRELRFNFENENGDEPYIELGELFSYNITAKDDTLSVTIYHDGETYESVTPINDWWKLDSFYFKAGLYLGVNGDNGSGDGQVSFYGLDFGHKDGEGLDGLFAKPLPSVIEETAPIVEETVPSVQETTPVVEETVPNVVETAQVISNEALTEKEVVDSNIILKVRGNDGNNNLSGTAAREILKGYDGNDVISGGAGNDSIWGNDGDDIITGGEGVDVIKGGNGNDIFAYNSIADAGDRILDFRAIDDQIDLTSLFNNMPGFDKETAFNNGFINLVERGGNVEIYVGIDAGSGVQSTLLATLLGTDLTDFDTSSFILPDNPAEVLADAQPATTPPPAPRPFTDTNDSLKVSGDSQDNSLYGGHGNDKIKGRDGDDGLFGGSGNDRLEGNSGADTLYGGLGSDTLKGGSGIDIYKYENINDGHDKITEFREGEKLDVSELVKTFEGAEGLNINELIDQGYLSYTENEDRRVHVYADIDGKGEGSTGAVELATLYTESFFDASDDIFLI